MLIVELENNLFKNDSKIIFLSLKPISAPRHDKLQNTRKSLMFILLAKIGFYGQYTYSVKSIKK